MSEYDDMLKHYGIKGMRWGVRRSEKQLSRSRKKLTPEQGEAKLSSLDKQIRSTKDKAKLKTLRKQYGEIEDSIDYAKPKRKANTSKKLTPEQGEAKLSSLDKQIRSTKDKAKRKTLEKQYGEVEDSIDYSKPKKEKKKYANSISTIKERGRAEKDVSRRLKNKEITRKEAKELRWQNFHNQYVNNSIYKKSYERRISDGQDAKKAMKAAYREMKMVQDLTISVADTAFRVAVSKGGKIVKDR